MVSSVVAAFHGVIPAKAGVAPGHQQAIQRQPERTPNGHRHTQPHPHCAYKLYC